MKTLTQANQQLTDAASSTPLPHLLQAKSHFIDRLLIHALHALDKPPICQDVAILAVGGYGRCELYLFLISIY